MSVQKDSRGTGVKVRRSYSKALVLHVYDYNPLNCKVIGMGSASK